MKFFEKYLREKVNKAETPLNTLNLWQAIEQKRKKRRRLLFFWWFFGVLIGLSGLGFAAFKWQESKVIASQKIAESSIAFTKEKEQNIDLKNNTSDSSTSNYNEKKTTENLSTNNVFVGKESISREKNTIDNVVKKQTDNLVLGFANARGTENIESKSEAIVSSENKEKYDKESTEKVGKNENSTLENQIFSSKEKEQNIAALPTLPLCFLEEKTKKEVEMSLVPLLEKPSKKHNNELLFAVGTGFANRIEVKSEDSKRVGTTKNLLAWNGNLSFRHHFENQYFIETGVQLNQIVNLLTHKNTSTKTVFYPDSLKRIALNTVTGEPYIAKDTFKVFRTTERQVFHYQYFTNVNLMLGVGKSWTKNRFKYQLGANAALLFYQKNKGIYLDENEISKNIEKVKGVNLSVNIYAQANYQLDKSNQFFARLSYWQYLQNIEKDTKYGIPSLAIGYAKRF